MMARSISASPNEATSPLRPCFAQAVVVRLLDRGGQAERRIAAGAIRCRRASASERRSWSKLSSLVSCGDLSNHFGTSSSADIPSPSRPSREPHARAHEHLRRLAQRDDAEAERQAQLDRPLVERGLDKRKARRSHAGSASHDAAHIADAARRAGRAVGLIDERLDRGIAGVAAVAQRRDDRREGERAFARTAPVRIVEMDMRDQAGRHPLPDQVGDRLRFCQAAGRAIDHGAHRRAADLRARSRLLPRPC